MIMLLTYQSLLPLLTALQWLVLPSEASLLESKKRSMVELINCKDFELAAHWREFILESQASTHQLHSIKYPQLYMDEVRENLSTNYESERVRSYQCKLA